METQIGDSMHYKQGKLFGSGWELSCIAAEGRSGGTAILWGTDRVNSFWVERQVIFGVVVNRKSSFALEGGRTTVAL